MEPLFGHEENPLRPDEWARMTSTVIEVARRALVCRRFIDLYGPLGPGVQTVPSDEFEGTEPGAVDIVGEAETATVFSGRRQFKTIPIVYKDFLLHWRDLEAARAHNMPLDVSAAAGAAAFCAEREDQLILFGDEPLGHEGLMNAQGRASVDLRDWGVAGSGYRNLVEATERLLSNGHYGPYAMVTSPRLYAALHRVFEKTGVLEVATLRELAGAGVFQSHLIRNDAAVVVSTGRENLDVAVAMDLSVAYLGAERMNHPFRVLESLLLRIKHPDAICTIEAPRSG